ncbi:MAG: DUF433 domain-containing protein [Planctomycetota bacterium]
MQSAFKNFDRITVDPDVLAGKPCVRGMRLSVERVLDVMSQNPSWDAVREDYPELEQEDLCQVLRFAAASLAGQLVPFDSSAA